MDFLDFSLDTVSKQQKTRQNFTGMDFLDFSLDQGYRKPIFCRSRPIFSL